MIRTQLFRVPLRGTVKRGYTPKTTCKQPVSRTPRRRDAVASMRACTPYYGACSCKAWRRVTSAPDVDFNVYIR